MRERRAIHKQRRHRLFCGITIGILAIVMSLSGCTWETNGGAGVGNCTTHTYGDKWESDYASHWRVCKECGHVGKMNLHRYDDENDTECNICKHVRNVTNQDTHDGTHQHTWSTEWYSNANYHYHACACGEATDIEEHIYTDQFDNTCNVCGYTRTIAHFHSWAPTMSISDTAHWYRCIFSGCSSFKNYGPHKLYSEYQNHAEHWIKCSYVGCTYKKGYVPHDKSKKNISKITATTHTVKCSCGTFTEAHSITKGKDYTSNDPNGTHTGKCKYCRRKFTAKHRFQLPAGYDQANETLHYGDCYQCGAFVSKATAERYPDAYQHDYWYVRIDGTYHNMGCNNCSLSTKQRHQPIGDEWAIGDEVHTGTCKDCGATIEVKHTYDDWGPSELNPRETHTGYCICGKTKEEAHKWDPVTGECTVCMYDPDSYEDDQDEAGGASLQMQKQSPSADPEPAGVDASEQEPQQTEQEPQQTEQEPQQTEQEPQQAEQEPQQAEQEPQQTEQEPQQTKQEPQQTKQEPQQDPSEQVAALLPEKEEDPLEASEQKQ